MNCHKARRSVPRVLVAKRFFLEKCSSVAYQSLLRPVEGSEFYLLLFVLLVYSFLLHYFHVWTTDHHISHDLVAGYSIWSADIAPLTI